VPTYGYECTACKDQFEVVQRITEDALAIHEGCGGELRRLLYPVGIVFKGPGFHVNDYGRNGKNSTAEKQAQTKSDDPPAKAATESKSDSTTTATTETKTETKSEPTASKAE
jgi:putative FmdB family regulatory protein